MIKSIINFCCIGSKPSKSKNVYCEPCKDKQPNVDDDQEVTKKDKMIVIVISKMAKKGVYMSAVRMDPVSPKVDDQPHSHTESSQSEHSIKEEKHLKSASVDTVHTQTKEPIHHTNHQDAQTGDGLTRQFHLFEEWLKEREHQFKENVHKNKVKKGKVKREKAKAKKQNKVRINTTV